MDKCGKVRIFRRYHGQLTVNSDALDRIAASRGIEALGGFMTIVNGYLRNGPIPDNSSSASLVAASASEWRRWVRPLLSALFEKGADGLWHRQDLDVFIAASSSASDRGRKAVQARWEKYRAAKEASSSARHQQPPGPAKARQTPSSARTQQPGTQEQGL